MTPAAPILLPSDDARYHRLRPRRIVGIAITVAGLVLFTSGVLVHIVGLSIAGTIGTLVGAVIAASARRRTSRKGRAGDLRLAAGTVELRVGDEVVSRLPAAEIERGWIEHGGELPNRLVLEAQGSVIDAALDDDSQPVASELLHALGYDAQALRMRLDAASSGARGLGAGCAILGALVFAPAAVALFSRGLLFGPMALYPAGIAVVGILLGLFALDFRDVTIGADGVDIRQSRRQRYIPFSRLRDVRREGNYVLLVTDADKLSLRCATPVIAYTVALRIIEALGAWRGDAPPLNLDELERGTDDAPAWHQRMTNLLQRSIAYRARSFQRDDLWNVVRSPTAPPDRRVGAALALAASASAQDRDELRIEAAHCAHPSLRIAIEQAAEGELEDEALTEAMVAFEER